MAHFTCEVVYRGIFQKNLAARICWGIVLSARKAGRWGTAFGGYGDSPSATASPPRTSRSSRNTQEELEQNMACYEPKEVDVTICVDDTLSKGVESWAWYGLQPINRLTVSGGTVLMTSLQSPAGLLTDIHKKDAPYDLDPRRGPVPPEGLGKVEIRLPSGARPARKRSGLGPFAYLAAEWQGGRGMERRRRRTDARLAAAVTRCDLGRGLYG